MMRFAPLVFAIAALACAPVRALTQRHDGAAPSPEMADADSTPVAREAPVARDTTPPTLSHIDSLQSERTFRLASRAEGLRVLVSLAERRLRVLEGADTLLDAEVAVGMGSSLEYRGHVWTFTTPRGIRVVRAKRQGSAWRPPEWAYAEVARDYDLKLASLKANKPVTLHDGRKLVVRDSLVGLLLPDGFAPLPVDEHIVFDSTLYVPPLGTKNRSIEGELGLYQLDLGNGYLLHGTPHEESIGSYASHGCVRLRGQDIEWLYDHVPVGTRVYIY